MPVIYVPHLLQESKLIMIEYNEYDLLELFESEPKIAGEGKAGRYEYEKLDKNGFQFKLYFSLYDDLGSITLRYRDLHIPIFEMNLTHIESIICTGDRLTIQQKNNSKKVVAYFKPNYIVNFEEKVT